MKAKLTLNVDKLIIEKSKKLAQNEGRSLSDLVEGLLNERIIRDTRAKHKLINELFGAFGEVKESTDWKEVIRDSSS